MTSIASRLPPELVAEIAFAAVLTDTPDRTWSALPVVKNVAWSDFGNRWESRLDACAPSLRDCATTGFVERSENCSLTTDPGYSEEDLHEPDLPDDIFHAAFVCTQVCHSWREAIRGYSRLWAAGGLLNLNFIYRSKALARNHPPQLVNLRPLCACFLEHCVPVLSTAEKIVFTTYAFQNDGAFVTETVFEELNAAAGRPEASALNYIDLELTSPQDAPDVPTREKVLINSLITVRLTNTHFICYGHALSRLELVEEDGRWRMQADEILELLTECPSLEHLSLVMVCHTELDVSLEDTWNPDEGSSIVLKRLSCFILEDETRQCLQLLSSIVFAPVCDFHWTIIEPFGMEGYAIEDLQRRLDFVSAIYASRTIEGPLLSVAVLEVIRDFDGSLFRARLEWPEEMRVTFAATVPSALKQFTYRKPRAKEVLFRDLSSCAESARRSFAVRSRMLSTCVASPASRWRPFGYIRRGTELHCGVPDIEDVMSAFMSCVRGFPGFQDVDTVVMPRHAFHSPKSTTWEILLRGFLMNALVLEGIIYPHHLEGFSQHLAAPGRYPRLTNVRFPNLLSNRGEELSNQDIVRLVEAHLKGPSAISWTR